MTRLNTSFFNLIEPELYITLLKTQGLPWEKEVKTIIYRAFIRPNPFLLYSVTFLKFRVFSVQSLTLREILRFQHMDRLKRLRNNDS